MQKRFKLHALITVGILAAVHVVCFVLTLASLQEQRASMLQLGRSGEAQVGNAVRYLRTGNDKFTGFVLAPLAWAPDVYGVACWKQVPDIKANYCLSAPLLQKFMHQVMTDVRSLDTISKNKTLENLFTANDTDVRSNLFLKFVMYVQP